MADTGKKDGDSLGARLNSAKVKTMDALNRADSAPGKILAHFFGAIRQIFTIIFWIFSIVLKWIVLPFIILGVIFGIVLGGIFLWNCVGESGACGVVGNQIIEVLGDIGLGKISFSAFSTMLDFALHPENAIKQGENLGFDETQKTDEKIGVKIVSFSTEGIFEEGEPINADALIEINAPDDRDLIVDFSNACSLEGYTGNVEVVGAFDRDKSVIVRKGSKTERIEISCEFGDGVKSIEKALESRIATVRPMYSVVQDVDWAVAAKNIEEADDEDIGQTKAISNGPMTLTLFSEDSQPFYANRVYRIHLELDNNDILYSGNLEKLESVRLEISQNADLVADDKFCELKAVSNSREGYNYYEVDSKEIDKANVDCSLVEFLVTKKITRAECYRNLKSNLDYSCKFKFNSAEDEVAKHIFRAEAVYSYASEKTTLVKLEKVA